MVIQKIWRKNQVDKTCSKEPTMLSRSFTKIQVTQGANAIEKKKNLAG
jgi:hypothetical protein